MKAIMYRNCITMKPYLYLLLALTVLSLLIAVAPIFDGIKIIMIMSFGITIHFLFLASLYLLYSKINHHHSEISFLSMPVSQTTTVHAHYLTAVVLMVWVQISLGLIGGSVLFLLGSEPHIDISSSGLLLNLLGNLLTVSLIFPTGENKRFLKIPLILWLIVVGILIPSMSNIIDAMGLSHTMLGKGFMENDIYIYVTVAFIMFIVSYIVALTKAKKQTITV